MRRLLMKTWRIFNSVALKDMIKSLMGFSLAAWLTFNSEMHEIIGYSSHMAAVAILFFHPSKSIGGMFEAVLMGISGVFFGSIVAGIGIIVSTNQYMQQFLLLKAAVLLLLLFTSSFILSFLRARSSSPPVYTGTIIAHLIIFSVITAEESVALENTGYQRIRSLILAIGFGILISMLTNIILWPKSAFGILRNDVRHTMQSVGNLLSVISETFLLGDNSTTFEDIEHTMELHQIQFIHLNRSSVECNAELFPLSGSNNKWQSVVSSLNRLSRHLGGLKSGVVKLSKWNIVPTRGNGIVITRPPSCNIQLLLDMIRGFQPAIRELSYVCQNGMADLELFLSNSHKSFWQRLWCFDYAASKERDRILLLNLIKKISDALKTFERRQKKELKDLYQSGKYDGSPADEVFVVQYFVFCMLEFAKELKNGLIPKLAALCDLNISPKNSTRREESVPFVSETLVDDSMYFDKEESASTASSSRREIHKQRSRRNSRYFQYLQSQTNDEYHSFLKFPASTATSTLQSSSDKQHSQSNNSRENNGWHEKRSTTIRNSRLEESYLQPYLDPPIPPIPVSALLRYRLWLWHFLSELRNSFNLKFALKTAILVTGLGSLAFITETENMFHKFRMHWAMISVVVVMTPTVGGTNIAGLYRILGTCLGASYSFAITYIVQSVLQLDPEKTGKWAIYAAICTFAAPCLYLILFSRYPRVGQVMLVTVSSIALAHQSNVHNENWDLSIGELAVKQGMMVTLGIFLGLVINWYVWPFEARVELRKGLADLLLNMGVLYSRLVDVFNSEKTDHNLNFNGTNSPPTTRLSFIPTGDHLTASTLHNYYYAKLDAARPQDTYSFFLTFELKLRMAVLRLEQLIPLTWLEPRLKGPFPVEIYKQMVKKCRLILDKFAAMRVALGNHLKLSVDLQSDQDDSMIKNKNKKNNLSRINTTVQADMLLGPSAPVSKKNSSSDKSVVPHELLPYRRELVGAVLLSFYVYSSSLILKQPLPTYLPSMKQARQRLMEQIHFYMTNRQSQNYGNGPDEQQKPSTDSSSFIPATVALPEQFMNFYAYSLAMEDVIGELEELGQLLKSLFGEMFADVIPRYFDQQDVQQKKDPSEDAVLIDVYPTAMVEPQQPHENNGKWPSNSDTVDVIISEYNDDKNSESDTEQYSTEDEQDEETNNNYDGRNSDEVAQWWRASGNFMI